MAKDNLYQDIPKIVLQHYNMDVDVRVQDGYSNKKIYVWIIFRPKKINSITPEPTNF